MDTKERLSDGLRVVFAICRVHFSNVLKTLSIFPFGLWILQMDIEAASSEQV